MKKIEFDFNNIGGMAELYAIPLSSFLRVRRNHVTKKNVLEVQNRADIIAIPIYANDSFYFLENHAYDDGGDYFDVEIGGVIPKLAQDNADLIETLQRGRWMVLSQDLNGTVHLSGNEDVLMKFEDSKSSGTRSSERNQNAFTFKCKSDRPSEVLDMDDLANI